MPRLRSRPRTSPPPGVDDIREHVLGDLTFSKEVREQVAALYPTQPEFKEEIDQDAARFLSAMTRAGLDPEIDSQKLSVESINYRGRSWWREPRRSQRRSWASKASRERARPARRNRTSSPARRSS
jgi:hypothetical protein